MSLVLSKIKEYMKKNDGSLPKSEMLGLHEAEVKA